ncbi:hypothetical protein GCM10022388_13340 [Flavobacterium chungnamense]|uniref:POTRA domain-containing protein n=1 Tax=Flavobacterium chungnamense TaxID=706182 RepID=A0ABP7UQ11_9FLAO
MRYYFYLVMLFFSCQILSAQSIIPTKSDSVYKKIDDFSKERKFFKVVHKLMFRPRKSEAAKIQKQKGASPIQKSFEKYSCRIIRNITIETTDPFGYSAENEKEVPEKKLERYGNSLHVKSKKWTIKNLLLFKKNQELDSLLIKESERLIRSQRFVRSVVIKPIAIENCQDSIDISVRVLDTWSLIPTGAFSNSKANLELTQRNFFGLGHEASFDYIRSFTNNTFAYDSRYSIQNIKNTFINTSVSSRTDLENNTYKAFKIERPFYSTLAHWAGGFYYDYKNYSEFLTNANLVTSYQNYKIKTYEFWAAHSSKIFAGNSDFSRATNLITSLGFTNTTYLKQPELSYDPIRFSNSSKRYLATIGISSQQFYQDKYLFRFGVIEDIPYGKVFSFTGGFENKNNLNRAYFGGRFSYGDYLDFGYISANIEYGSFFNNGKTEQTTIKIETNYFTNLFSIGNWKFRQFVRPVLVLGSNRLNTTRDRLNLIDVNGIPGFNSSPLVGTRKFLTTFQTQSYNPKNWYGFNLSPFMNFTIGFLDNGNHKFFNNKMYSQIGVGVLINNNYLIFNSFQFSFSYYPSLPIDGSNIIKTNTFQNTDINFNNFQIGQPYVLPYE